MALQLPRRRFTVDEYYRLAQAGILQEDERVELLDGLIIEMAPITPRHAACVTRLNRVFGQRLRDFVLVSVHNPIRLDEHNEPEPDVALLRPKADFYRSGHPGPTDVRLLIEVADTSEPLELRVKLPLYARSGIAEVWLVDLDKETVGVHREPVPSGFGIARTLRRSEKIAPLAFPELEIAVAEILGEE
jgi:Uma2 family endonuclease